MIKGNSLSDKLNSFKNKQGSSLEDPSVTSTNSIVNTIVAIFLFLISIFKSFVFGYSISLIFATNWKFIEYMAVGFAISYLMTYIYDLIYDRHEKL